MSEFRRRLLMQSKSLLPSEYQRVEYIESTGEQYLQFNYSIKEYSEISAIFQYQSFKSGDNYLFRQNSNIGGSWFAINNMTRFYVRFSASSSTNHLVDENFIYAKHKLILNKNECLIDDVMYNKQPYLQATTFQPFVLFKFDVDTYRGQLFDFCISEDGIEVIHLIPCYRKSDGEIGLYDIVNNIFYTNLGTGEFIKGADV